MKIQSHKLNFSSFKNVKEVEKSAVYVDSPLNRKLGRVGMPYKKIRKKKDVKDEDFIEEKIDKVTYEDKGNGVYSIDIKDVGGAQIETDGKVYEVKVWDKDYNYLDKEKPSFESAKEAKDYVKKRLKEHLSSKDKK